MSDLQTKLDYANSIADWFLEISEAHNLRGDLEEGLKCTFIAATILSRQNRDLSSPRIESNLRIIADCLAERNGPRLPSFPKTRQKEVCLHVLGEALPAGGLTAMAIRWMKNDGIRRTHSVALLSQQTPIPDSLLQVVRGTGGSVYTANPVDSFLHQAEWLKNLANDLANYVILHIDMADVICGVAFGTKGGPPVLLVNHAAHVFWTGASFVDLVVNCRGSALERLWTSLHRGISRCATIPIPLLEQAPFASERASGFERKHQAKEIVGIPTDSIAILTVGALFKYLPVNGLDFVEACESTLKQVPNAYLLVVGFVADSRWKKASIGLGSRIRVLGTVSQSQLDIIREAADVYIEGFPFGTTTSLLEAGLKGIPVVLAPAQCPPPYGSDGVALDEFLERPSTLEEYKSQIIQLSKDSYARTILGDKIRDAIAKHHTGLGWKRYLDAAIRALPDEHSTYPSVEPVRTPEAIHEYWSAFETKWRSGYEETIELAVSRALSIGLRPRLSKAVLQACRGYRSVRIFRTIPLPLLVFLCNFLLPVLPIAWAHNVFRFFSFLCRGALLSRMRSRVVRLFGGTDYSRSWYGEYRSARGSGKVFQGAERKMSEDLEQK
jgi:hypothetical protein